MKIFGTLLALMLVLAFTSCQQEIDGNMPGAPDDTVLLKSVIYFDTTKPGGLDTNYKSEYRYDASGRLTNMDQVEFDYAGTVIHRGYFYYQMFYNGITIKPFKIISGGNHIHFLYYDVNFNRIKDSSFFDTPGGPAVVRVRTYASLSPGKFYTVEKEKDMTTGIITVQDSSVYRRDIVAGNIVNAIDTTFWSSVSSNNKALYTYDTKRNPFASLAATQYMGQYFYIGDGALLPMGTNNATSYSETHQFGTSIDHHSATLTYQFRADGLPVSGKISGHPDFNKVVFSYY